MSREEQPPQNGHQIAALEVEEAPPLPDASRAPAPLPLGTLAWLALAMLMVGFAGGFSLSAATWHDAHDSTHDKEHKETQTGTDPSLVESEAPGLLATRLRLANISKEGDGWAPWQFAIKGDTILGYDGLCHEWCFEKPSSWRNFNGIWVLALDPDNVPGVKYRDDERIAMRLWANLENHLEEPSLMHFHGFVPPNNLDGIPWISANPLQPKSQVFYDFMIRHRGFYWVHSHFGHQLEAGLYAPIIVKDHPKFLQEIGNPIEVPMLVFDGHWRTECAYQKHVYPDECPTGGFDGYDTYQITVNNHDLRSGKAHVVQVEPGLAVRLRILEAGAMAVFRIHLGGLTGEVLATDGRRVQRGKFVKSLEMAGAERFDVLLKIPQEEGSWHIIAQRTTTHNRLENSTAERGVLVLATKNAPHKDLPPAFSPEHVEPYTIDGFTKLYSGLHALKGLRKPLAEPHIHFRVRLTGDYDNHTGEWKPNFDVNDKKVFVWPHRVWCRDSCHYDSHDPDGTVVNMVFCQGQSISSNIHCTQFSCNEGSHGRDEDGRCMPEHATMNEWKGVPISDCSNWHVRPALFKHEKTAMEVCQGDRVWITYISETPSEGHPMHLHGTHQQLVKVNGKGFIGPKKDTWFVPKGQEITVAFDAVNPGSWLLHCHIGHHVNEGMSTLLTYTASLETCTRDRSNWYTKLHGKKAKWEHTRALPQSEWPETWKQLWKKKPLDTR